jgi:hypothetical protein
MVLFVLGVQKLCVLDYMVSLPTSVLKVLYP